MASDAAHSPADKPGLAVETTTILLGHKPSQDTISQPFPALEEKDTRYSRRSDVSTPATARVNPFDADIEAMPVITNDTSSGRRSAECTKGGSDCHAWPGQDHWKRKAKAAKKNRHSCNCLASLSKRNRIIAKILIIVLIVGIAVGVGFGVSKPLGAGIWRSETQNS
ncbi:hypothetical protein C8A00DRAFT_16651 [Chaetomidium leptoderma]|uniref:Uncharacterized protein n=1 Tax=Chaetomidium leptoderma TaxID=669021 RepID=A0AAN6VKQ2_9PEZI|nr:hypothetical protein C8A00DRAFT_16651 [Chaetomidium leptoderma]